MLHLNIKNETSRLRAVVLGTALDNGPIPTPEECYDPKSLQHVLAGTYPKEEDMIAEMEAVSAVLKKYDVTVYRPEVLEDYNQIFARDISFVIEDKIIIANILPDRKREVEATEYVWSTIEKKNRIILPDECHVEGGDVILFNDYVFIGVYSGEDYPNYITARTNLNAVNEIKTHFPNKIIKTFELRKSNSSPMDNALHLDCCFQPLGRGKALLHREGFTNQEDFIFLEKLLQQLNHCF